MGFILNSNSVIMCPHGGMVVHTPLSGTSYRIDGRPPMLMEDLYQIAGCPFNPQYGGPCCQVRWVTASNLLVVKGRFALIESSVGMCLSVSGVSNGPAIVTAIRSTQMEPETFTSIDY